MRRATADQEGHIPAGAVYDSRVWLKTDPRQRIFHLQRNQTFC